MCTEKVRETIPIGTRITEAMQKGIERVLATNGFVNTADYVRDLIRSDLEARIINRANSDLKKIEEYRSSMIFNDSKDKSFAKDEEKKVSGTSAFTQETKLKTNRNIATIVQHGAEDAQRAK